MMVDVNIYVCTACWAKAHDIYYRRCAQDENYDGTPTIEYRQLLETTCIDEGAISAFGIAY